MKVVTKLECMESKMNQDAIIPKANKRSSSKMINLGEERESSKVILIRQESPQDSNGTIELRRSKRRISLTKATIIKREEGPLHIKKQKEKVTVDSDVTKKKPLSKRRLSRRNFQKYEGSGVSLEKRDQLGTQNLGSKEKQSKEATHDVESQLKTTKKPKNLTKPKNGFSLQLTNIREETFSPTQSQKNILPGVYSTMISKNEEEKSNLQEKDLVYSRSNSNFKTLSSQHLKSRTKKKTSKNRKSINALDKMVIQKSSLKEKHRNGSHGLHALRNPIVGPIVQRKVNNKSIEGAQAIETTEGNEQTQGIQTSNTNVDISNSVHTKKGFQSKATAIALKLANDTLGFVRTTLKAVEDSKNNNLKVKRVSKTIREDDRIAQGIDSKPNGILSTAIATRYKSTLESLQINKTLSTEKLIEELGAIKLDSKGNATKAHKLGRRQGGRPTRSTLKKYFKDGATPRDNSNKNENTRADVFDNRKQDARHIKLGRKTRKNIEKQMKKYGLVDTTPQIQGFIESVERDVETKKSRSPMASGFDRLISGASGNKEFESCLAQIVSSHDAELAWTKEQEKALQNAYLSIKQSDGDFWQLISKEVPGRNAKECYDRFYSRHPTPSAEAETGTLATITQQSQVECLPPLSKPPNTKSKVTSLKVTRKQKLETQETIRNILGYVDCTNSYKTNNATMENNVLHSMLDLGSILDRGEDEKAVILQYSNTMIEYNNIDPCSHVEEDTHTNHDGEFFFENVTITGVSTPSDKENSQPLNGQETNPKKLGVPRVELILKQVDNGEHLPCESRPKTTSNNNRKKKIIKTNNVYLHSKEALDFGDTTLDAIQVAKQELRNVFSRTRSRGGNYFDIEVDQI